MARDKATHLASAERVGCPSVAFNIHAKIQRYLRDILGYRIHANDGIPGYIITRSAL